MLSQAESAAPSLTPDGVDFTFALLFSVLFSRCLACTTAWVKHQVARCGCEGCGHFHSFQCWPPYVPWPRLCLERNEGGKPSISVMHITETNAMHCMCLDIKANKQSQCAQRLLQQLALGVPARVPCCIEAGTVGGNGPYFFPVIRQASCHACTPSTHCCSAVRNKCVAQLLQSLVVECEQAYIRILPCPFSAACG